MTAERHYCHQTEESVTVHADAILAAITPGSIPLASLVPLTASRIVASDASGVLTVNAAGTANRLAFWDGTGSLGVNAVLTANRLIYGDTNGLPASNAALTQNRVVTADANGLPSSAAAITASRMLVSDSNGLPTHGNATTTEANYVAGLTSAAQTQINGKSADCFGYTFSSTTTMADPGTGVFRFNNATLSSVTAIAISDTDLVGGDRDAVLNGLATVFFLEFVALHNPIVRARFLCTAQTDNGAWHQLTVTYIDGYNSFTNGGTCVVRITGPVKAADLAAFTASRVIMSSSTGALQTNAALTDNRLVYQSAAGVLSSNAALTQNRVVIGDANGLPTPASAITGSRMLVSDANGVPTHGNATTTEANYVAGVTSAIQTQLDSKTGDHGWTYISTTDASGASTVDFQGLTGYDVFKMVILDLRCSTDGTTFLLRVSTDGSTYITTASYHWAAAIFTEAAATTNAGAAGATSIQLTTLNGNASSSEAFSGTLQMMKYGAICRFVFDASHWSSIPGYYRWMGHGFNTTGSAVVGIRFLPGAGTVTGRFRLYGLKES